jgi:tetratricopeptide (TPR) repeat protein
VLEDDRGAALVLLHLAMLDRADGLLDRAATKTQEALRLGEDKAAPEELAQAMNLLGVLACDRGELDSALGYLQEGLKLAAGTDRRMETYLLNNIGEVQLWLGRMDEAGEALSRAMDLAAEQEDLRALAEIHRNVARLSLWKNRAERAVSYADRALALAEQIGSAESKAEAALVVAEVRAAAGTPEGGEKPDALFARAVEILRGIGHKVELARALLSWGAVLQMENRSAEAHPLLSEALQLFTEQGSKTAERVKALL